MMQETIKSALTLLTKNQGDGWFCVIEEPKNEKFVQFAWDESEGLWVDLPKVALTEDELARAVMMFSDYNISLESRGFASDDCCDDPECDCYDECDDDCDDDCDCCDHNGPIETFNGSLGKDIDKACEIAYRVLSEVYKLSENTRLNVTMSN